MARFPAMTNCDIFASHEADDFAIHNSVDDESDIAFRALVSPA
jgi:hypothetical protein